MAQKIHRQPEPAAVGLSAKAGIPSERGAGPLLKEAQGIARVLPFIHPLSVIREVFLKAGPG